MHRHALAILTILAFLLLGLTPALATDAPSGAKAVTNFGEKPVAYFNHDTHKDQGCATCHHNEGDGKFKCGDCHKLEAEGDAPKIKDAFHKKESGKCYSCHLLKGADQKMKCKECHKE